MLLLLVFALWPLTGHAGACNKHRIHNGCPADMPWRYPGHTRCFAYKWGPPRCDFGHTVDQDHPKCKYTCGDGVCASAKAWNGCPKEMPWKYPGHTRCFKSMWNPPRCDFGSTVDYWHPKCIYNCGSGCCWNEATQDCSQCIRELSGFSLLQTNAKKRCTVKSESTENMLHKLKPASENYGKCNTDIQDIKGAIDYIAEKEEQGKKAADNVKKLVDMLRDYVDWIDNSGVESILGMIPEVGVLIKIGLKQARVVIDEFDTLYARVEEWIKMIGKTTEVFQKVFDRAAQISDGIANFLDGSYNALGSAHKCAKETKYECDTAAADMEKLNKKAYRTLERPLDTVSSAGTQCHTALNPMKTMIKAMKKIIGSIADLAKPLEKGLAAARKFVDHLEDKVKEFSDRMAEAVLKSNPAQCAMSILSVVVKSGNLLTCPISEVVGAAGYLMKTAITTMMTQLESVMTKALNDKITQAVDVTFSKVDIKIELPDFKKLLKNTWLSDVMFATCTALSKDPDHDKNVLKWTKAADDLAHMELPLKITDEMIKDALLKEVLVADVKVPENVYESACVDAMNNMGVDFTACQEMWNNSEPRYLPLGKEKYVAVDEGIDVGHKAGHTLESCKKACTKNTKCNSFAHCPRHIGMCWMKDKKFTGVEPTRHKWYCETYYRVTQRAWKLQRFDVANPDHMKSHEEAYHKQLAFCKKKGGRLPTRKELCPQYDEKNPRTPSTPANKCEHSHSWVPYAGGHNHWMYIGCSGTSNHYHWQCKDHMRWHGKPQWHHGDVYGSKIDCMVPQ